MKNWASRTYRKDSSKSWVIAFAASSLMFLETGIIKSLGVLLPHIRDEFTTQTWVIGVAIALVPGFGALICILMGAASKIVPPHWTTAVSGMISAEGLVAASFSTNVYVLMLALILTGFSTGTTTVTIGLLSHYFDKYYKVAMVFATCGMSMGIIVMPLLTQFLLDMYGWRGTILLLGGIGMHSVVCGKLFKPVESDFELISPTEDANVEQKTATHEYEFKGWYTHITDSIDLKLFFNFPVVALIAISAGNGYCLTGWLIYIVPHALDVGFSPYAASAIAIAGGIGNFVGNCVFLIQGKIMSDKKQLYISVFAMSASLALDTVASTFSSYIGMVMCSITYNLFKGVMTTAWYTILNNMLDKELIINALGWSFAAYGGLSLLSGFVSGWLYDISGSYTASFLGLSAVCAVTFIPQCIADLRYTNTNTNRE